ncbi:b3 domain-containing protein [Arabis alpina]|uniref:B3 domain-containing protein n=1 Tax=Arabis alpina TaxID=50452 RepID=A0A087FZC0_ARAAL|nr:b3 domain-containing protein [Arabis alpina]
MVTTRKARARAITASHHQPPAEPKSPVNKFFQLVLPSAMKRNMMRIPTIFAKLKGSKLSKFVTLETPLGFKRSIKLKRIGEEIWFQEGWGEFAEAHSISEGHFLLFEYKGNSSFHIKIFNVSACEIDYPRDTVHISDSDSDDEIIDLTDQVFLEAQCTRKNEQSVNGGDLVHKPEKRPRDIDFEKILDDVDAIKLLKEEEEDKRVFRGKQFL